MILGAVPCYQHAAFEDPHGIQTAALLQHGRDIGEQRVEQGPFDRVDRGADLAVAWILLTLNSVSQIDRL